MFPPQNNFYTILYESREIFFKYTIIFQNSNSVLDYMGMQQTKQYEFFSGSGNVCIYISFLIVKFKVWTSEMEKCHKTEP
jgi:hypothetical protein